MSSVRSSDNLAHPPGEAAQADAVGGLAQAGPGAPSQDEGAQRAPGVRRVGAGRALRSLALTLLLIEFLDELVDGAMGAAWPSMRQELGFNYAEFGALLAVPVVFGAILEPTLGLWSDLGRRRAIIAGGGLGFALASALTGGAWNYGALMASRALFYPSSGAFVSISQAALMEQEPARLEVLMARWTLAGSLGVVIGPLLVGAALWGGAGWRVVFVLFALMALWLTVRIWRQHPAQRANPEEPAPTWGEVLAEAKGALGRGRVWKWLGLLSASDLLLDVLAGLLGLYLVDARGWGLEAAALAAALRAGVGLVGDALFVPISARVDGLRWVRWTAVLALIVYPLFMVARESWLILACLAVLGFLVVGWYAVLKARLYACLPERTGTVVAISSVFSLFESLVPLGLGALAEVTSIEVAMWTLVLGPLLLFVGARAAPGEPSPRPLDD